MNENIFSLEYLLDDITDLVQSVALDGKFLYVNRAWRETLGYAAPEAEQMAFTDIIHPESLEHCREIFQRVCRGETVENIEAKFTKKNGEILYVNGISRSIFRDDKPFITRSVFRNVTKRRLIEQKKLESETLFGAFMNNSPAILFMKDEAGRYVYINKTFERFFQVEAARLLGVNDYEWQPAEVAKRGREVDFKVLSSQQNVEGLQVTQTPGEESRYWSVFKFPFTDAAGKRYVGGAAIDITTQKKIELDLERKQREVETLVEHSSDVIVRLDTELRFIYVNTALEKLFSLKKQDFIGKTFIEASLIDDSFRNAEREIRATIAEAREMLFEMQFPFVSGWRYFQVRATPEMTADGKRVESVLIVARDTTERKEMEEAVRRSEQHYRNLVEDGQGFLFTHSRSGDLLSTNLAAAQSLGYEIAELIGRNLRVLLREEDFDELFKYLEKVWREKSADGIIEIFDKTGKKHFWKYHNVKLTETVETPFVLGYAQDVTDLKESEKHLKNLSLTDDLTGLYNRRGFLTFGERQFQYLRLMPRMKNNYLIYADMDGLKQINDRLGHETGSQAIVKMSEILKDNFRGSDLISRLGGDEFVVLMFNADDENAETIVSRLQSNIESYNDRQLHSFNLALSVGVTPIDTNEIRSLNEILADADRQMYEQKRRRKQTTAK